MTAAKPADELRKRCSKCKVSKPVKEFGKMTAASDGRYPQCAKCRQGKAVTTKAVLRSRARSRALRDLEQAHAGEFAVLLAFRFAEAKAEAAELAETVEGQEHFTETVPRLTGGKRREGQTVVDRIDVARCPDCVKSHDAGHECSTCGATPADPRPRKLMARKRPAPTVTLRREGGTKAGPSGLDPAPFREFNAGTARAARGRL